MTTAILKKAQTIDFPAVNWKVVAVCSSAACFLLLVFYVLQVTALTRGYYLENSYERQLSALSQENKDLQIAFAEGSFWGRAMEKIQALNFQKTDFIKYIQLPGADLARAD